MIFVGTWKLRHEYFWKPRECRGMWTSPQEAGYSLGDFWLVDQWLLVPGTQPQWTILGSNASLDFKGVCVNLAAHLLLSYGCLFWPWVSSSSSPIYPPNPNVPLSFCACWELIHRGSSRLILMVHLCTSPGLLLVKILFSRMDSIYQTSRIREHWHWLQARFSLECEPLSTRPIQILVTREEWKDAEMEPLWRHHEPGEWPGFAVHPAHGKAAWDSDSITNSASYRSAVSTLMTDKEQQRLLALSLESGNRTKWVSPIMYHSDSGHSPSHWPKWEEHSILRAKVCSFLGTAIS